MFQEWYFVSGWFLEKPGANEMSRRRSLLGPGLLDGVLGREDVEVGAAARALEVDVEADVLELELDLANAAQYFESPCFGVGACRAPGTRLWASLTRAVGRVLPPRRRA